MKYKSESNQRDPSNSVLFDSVYIEIFLSCVKNLKGESDQVREQGVGSCCDFSNCAAIVCAHLCAIAIAGRATDRDLTGFY